MQRILVTALVLWSAVLFGEGGRERLREAYFETFYVRLGALETAGEKVVVQSEEPCPVELPAWRGGRFCGLDAWSWRLGFWVCCCSVAVLCIDGVRRCHLWYSSEKQREYREAWRAVEWYVRKGGEASGCLAGLKQILKMPRWTTLSEMSTKMEGRFPELSAACRRLEAERFSGNGDGGAEPAFRSALRREVNPLRYRQVLVQIGGRRVWAVVAGIVVVSVMSWVQWRMDASGAAWEHGRAQARDGRQAEALEVFTEMTWKEPSCPELSEAMSRLSIAVEGDIELGEGWRKHGELLGGGRGIFPEALLVVLCVTVLTWCYAVLLGRVTARRVMCVLVLLCSVFMVGAVWHRGRLCDKVVAVGRLTRTPDADGEVVCDGCCELGEEQLTTADRRYVKVRVRDGEGWQPASRVLRFRLFPWEDNEKSLTW